MHEVLLNRLGGLILPRKSVVRLTDRPDMTLDVYHGDFYSDPTTIGNTCHPLYNVASLFKFALISNLNIK